MEEQVRPLYHVVDLEYLRELYFGLLFGSGQGRGARHIVLLLLLCSSSCVDYANDGWANKNSFVLSKHRHNAVRQHTGSRGRWEALPQFMFSLALLHGLLSAQWCKARSTLSLSSCCSFSLLSGTTVPCYLCLEVAKCSEAGAAQRRRHRWLFSIHQLLAGNL